MTEAIEDRLRRAFVSAANTTHVPVPPCLEASMPDSNSSKVHRGRHRFMVAAAFVGGLSAVALPVAAATGVAPSIRDAFGWSHTPNSPIVANDASGRLVLSTQGPGGQPMQLYKADTVDGGQCLTLLLPQQQQGPKAVAASSCTPAQGLPPGMNYSGGAVANGYASIVSAPGAQRMTLTVDGKSRDLPVAEGLSGVWLNAGEMATSPTVISYDVARHRLGQITLLAPDVTLPISDKPATRVGDN